MGKTFYNGKKLPLIPPYYKLESDFRQKANYLNEFFAPKCTPLNNGSTLPHSLSNTPTVEFSFFQFNDQDILKIIGVLHVNKTHVCDDIWIHMVKIFYQSVVKPLSIIYQNRLNIGIWKKSNIVPGHKKGDKQVVKNYRSALGKITFQLNFLIITAYLVQTK